VQLDQADEIAISCRKQRRLSLGIQRAGAPDMLREVPSA